MTKYCQDCKDIYNLNDRASQIFDSKCDICGRSGPVYFCTITFVDKELEVVFWKAPINIEINKRVKTILIDQFDNLFTLEEMTQYRALKFISDRLYHGL